MRTKSKTGLTILASGFAFVGAANAIELINNGSFESITGGTPQYGGKTDGTAPGWNGVVSTLQYSGTVYFAGPPIPASESPGSYHSWRHQSAVGAYSSFSTPTTDVGEDTKRIRCMTGGANINEMRLDHPTRVQPIHFSRSGGAD